MRATSARYTLALVPRINLLSTVLPTEGTGWTNAKVGKFVDELIATIVEFAAQTSLYEVIATTVGAWALIGCASLALAYWRLFKAHKEAEAQLIEKNVGRHSTNWANTAENLERKSLDPAAVALSSAMTHIYMLDEAANAWLKGSQWQAALRVTRRFLRECCHAIAKPDIHEDDMRAAADLIAERLRTYPDLSRAGSESAEVAVTFLNALDLSLSVILNNPRVERLRKLIAEARESIEAEEKPKAAE